MYTQYYIWPICIIQRKFCYVRALKPPIMNLFIGKVIQCYNNIPVLWQIIWGEQKEQREVYPEMGAKNLLFVHMGIHCGGSVTERAEDYHFCKFLLRNGKRRIS